MEKEVLIELNNVSKLVKGDWIINHINLSVYRGDGIAFFGQKNSGKDVLTRIIDNSIRPSGGAIDYFFDSKKIMYDIGVQMPNMGWPIGFRTKDVVKLYRNIYGISDDNWMNELIAIFNLNDIWKTDLSNLNSSWGLLFSIFLALLHKPTVVIFQDLSSNVSLDLRFELIDFLKRYKVENNATFIMVSPNDFVFNELCNRLIVMNKGKIVYDQYSSSWTEEQNIENITQGIIEKIKAKEIEASENKMIKQIFNDYVAKAGKVDLVVEAFIEKYQETFNHKNIDKDKDGKKIYNFIIKLYNIGLFENYTKNEIVKLLLGDLSLKRMRVLIEAAYKLRRILLEVTDAVKHSEHKKIDPKELKELEKTVLSFSNYISKKLIPLLKDKELIIENTENVIDMTPTERKKLKFLKKKYIAEELKELRHESRILKNARKIEG